MFLSIAGDIAAFQQFMNQFVIDFKEIDCLPRFAHDKRNIPFLCYSTTFYDKIFYWRGSTPFLSDFNPIQR